MHPLSLLLTLQAFLYFHPYLETVFLKHRQLLHQLLLLPHDQLIVLLRFLQLRLQQDNLRLLLPDLHSHPLFLKLRSHAVLDSPLLVSGHTLHMLLKRPQLDQLSLTLKHLLLSFQQLVLLLSQFLTQYLLLIVHDIKVFFQPNHMLIKIIVLLVRLLQLSLLKRQLIL